MTGGYKYQIDNYWALIPSAMLRSDFHTWPSVDLDLIFEYRNIIGFGVGTRIGDAVKLLFSYNFLRYFSLLYTFDMPYTSLGLSSFFSHEIGLIIQTCRLQNSKATDCALFR